MSVILRTRRPARAGSGTCGVFSRYTGPFSVLASENRSRWLTTPPRRITTRVPSGIDATDHVRWQAMRVHLVALLTLVLVRTSARGGDDLPDHAVARMGSIRLRVGG